jgi:hypothetical protein
VVCVLELSRFHPVCPSGGFYARIDLVDHRWFDCWLGDWKNHAWRGIRDHHGYRDRDRRAILGGWLMSLVGFASQGGMIYTIVVAIIGAVILTAIVRMFKKA